MTLNDVDVPELHALGFGKSLALAASPRPRFCLVRASERGTQVDLPAGWTSAWIALRGRINAYSARQSWEFSAGHLLTWQDGPLRLAAHSPAWYVGIAAPTALWTSRVRALVDGAGSGTLYTRTVPVGREVRRLMVRLFRRSGPRGPDAAVALGALLAALHESQSDLAARLQRCSGRTRLRQEQCLHRLLRVHNTIEHAHGMRVGLEALAEVARYSPTHLIRVYREVFGESPAEHAMRLRVDHSWRLVTDTRLTIGDISEAIGFESKSAFCRSFKARFGRTTSEVRQAVAS
jgi:AraC family transcriptional regulator